MEKPNIPEKEETTKVYSPDKPEQDILKYADKRIKEMKDYREKLRLEEKWKDADKECEVGEIEFEKGKKRFESDDELGLRTRLVNIGDERDDWRSKNSDPTLLSKIHTALSILIDKNPESVLIALNKKYEKNSALANSIWKRNWEITNAKDTLKLFVFNLAKYGWAVGRSYPRIIKYKKKILVELNQEDRSKDKFEEQEYIRFNDVFKQDMNPYRTWIDETARPYDRDSMKECYYEIDYTKDEFDLEFSAYNNYEFVGDSAKVVLEDNKEDKDRKDIITVGFFENRLRDMYVILIPSKKIVLHYSPLPNDDGYMSLWHTMWLLQSSESPYGVSMWEMIKQDKRLYDKMTNMTMDQLVLSIYKMFFYTGTSNLLADGQIKIKPGKGEQMVNGDIKWLEVPGPGQEAWEGLKFQKSKIDDNSSVPPILEGEITGKTLGEILHAKEASLKKMKMPLENISDAIEQDAYLTLSWSTQILSIPEIKEFTNEKELMDYENENGIQRSQLTQQTDNQGMQTGLEASYYPQISLHLEGRGGELFESKESRYFQVGNDIKPEQLKWQGIFKVLPKSILTPSLELEKIRKSEILQTISPFLQLDPMLYKKAVDQYLKVQEEDPEDWEPDSWLQSPEPSLFIDNPQLMAQQQVMQGQLPGQPGASGGQSSGQPTMNQAQTGKPGMMSQLGSKIGNALGKAFGR
jgi:hypothetical protein